MTMETHDSLLRIDNFSFYSRWNFADVKYQSSDNIWTGDLTQIRSFWKKKAFVNSQDSSGSFEVSYVRDTRNHNCLQLRRSN